MSEPPNQGFEEQLKQLIEVSNARRRKTVVALVKVLDDLRARGTKVFSVAIVGRECEARNLLSTQYIRNANGAPLRRLIDAYREKHGLQADNEPVRRLTPLEEAIDKISDLEVRMKLHALIDDNKALIMQVRRLEEGFKHLSSPSPPGPASPSVPEPIVEGEVLLPEPPSVLNLRPLDRFISAEWLDQNAWNISEAGAVIDGRHAITPPGFVPSLSAALQALKKGYATPMVIADG